MDEGSGAGHGPLRPALTRPTPAPASHVGVLAPGLETDGGEVEAILGGVIGGVWEARCQ